MIEQVHGNGSVGVLASEVQLVRGDVRDETAVQSALKSVDTVIHLAAESA